MLLFVLLRLAAVAAVLYLGFLGFMYWAMRQPPEAFGHVMKRMPGLAYPLMPFAPMWTHARAGSLVVGDAAPDFERPTADKSDRIRLSSLTSQKPVVLVFGSYT